MMLHLIPVSGDDACFRVFQPLCFAVRGAHYTRFCGLTRCTTQSHLKQKLDQDLQQSGWYMEAGSGAIKGVIHEISFPMGTDGPITPATAARLMDPSQPFTMTPGQWGFFHNEWITRGVEFLSLSSEGSRAPGGIPVPFQRDTDTLSATSGVEESKDEVGDVPLQAPRSERPDQIDSSPEAEEASATS